jgi:hypothetical protein
MQALACRAGRWLLSPYFTMSDTGSAIRGRNRTGTGFSGPEFSAVPQRLSASGTCK